MPVNETNTCVNSSINLNLEFATKEEKFVIKVGSTTIRQFHLYFNMSMAIMSKSLKDITRDIHT
jgi:hypothetical protein